MSMKAPKNAFEIAKLTVPAFLLKERRPPRSAAVLSTKVTKKSKQPARVFISFDEAAASMK